MSLVRPNFLSTKFKPSSFWDFAGVIIFLFYIKKMFFETLQKYLPPIWYYKEIEDYRQVLLPRDSPIFINLEASMFGIHGLNIKCITQVESPYFFGQFLLKKAEYETRGNVNILELFHATGAHKVHSILTYNLDWRLVFRAKFGNGISFSPHAWYAHLRASPTCGTDRAMIVTDVLVGYEEEVLFNSPVLPDCGYDTTTGNRKRVYVKYYDNEFFPKHVIYYNDSSMG